MMIVKKPPFYSHRKPAKPKSVAPLTLVAASYLESDYVQLSFDRAIDASGLDGTQITIDDGTYGLGLYDATGGTVTMIDPSTVRITLGYIDGSHNPGVFLTATALSGIVAVDDGGTWAGVTHVGLPF